MKRIIELPITGHVFVADSVVSLTPLTTLDRGIISNDYDYYVECCYGFTVVGVGFKVDVRVDLSTTICSDKFLNKEDLPTVYLNVESANYKLAVDANDRTAKLWYEKCKNLIFSMPIQ